MGKRACDHLCGCILNHRTKETGKFCTNASGASLATHRANLNLHPNCGPFCPFFKQQATATTTFASESLHRDKRQNIESDSGRQDNSHQQQKSFDAFEEPCVYFPPPESLPAVFTSYETFISAYALESGSIIQFQRVSAVQWELVGSLSGNKKMTISDWDQWYRKEAALPPEDRTEALYLVNIPVKTLDHKCLQTDPITAMLRSRGTMCLNRYLNMYDEHMPIPDMDARLYLAPSWTGSVLTPPHFDGHGTQMSLHRVLMGDGYNLVHIWPSLLPFQDFKWRQVVGLPPPHEPQSLPHDMQYYIDSSAEVWDAEKETLLQQWGIHSTKFQVRSGQAIVLPSNKAHVFKKIGNPKIVVNTGAISVPIPVPHPVTLQVPLLGYAGDCSYVGPSAESFVKHLLTIKYGHQLIRKHQAEVYSFSDLAVLCLVWLGCERPNLLASDSIMKEHFIGALVSFREFVQEEKLRLECFFASRSGGKIKQPETIEVLDSDAACQEIICTVCKCCLVNFYLYFLSKYLCYQCWNKMDNKRKNKSQGRLRFMTGGGLDTLLSKQTHVCNNLK